MNVAMIGCGKLGAPCANEMQRAGHRVVGYDVKDHGLAEFPILGSIREAVEGAELIFVAVPTPHSPEYGGETPTSDLVPKDFDYSIVRSVLDELDRYCNQNQLVVLISTVLPGTVRRSFMYNGMRERSFRFIYNPYLIAMGSVNWDMVNPEMVIIGTKDGKITGDAHILLDFYKTVMKNEPRYEIGTWDEAECIKIFYNTFISAKIGLVNMIQDVAEASGNIDVDVVTGALARSTMRITGPAYMRAGMGDAGACHPRDNIALRFLAEKLGLGYDLFGSIMHAREVQAENVAKELVNQAKLHNLPIYIHGKAYKPGVSYTEGSYSLLVGHYVEKMGHKVYYIDPLTHVINDYVGGVKGVILMAHHAPTTYSHSHLIGSEKQAFYCDILPGSVIVDIWRYLKHSDVPKCFLIPYGNTR
jgi:UDPglucose 6-dehydrogenase